MLENCLVLNVRDFRENSLLVTILHPQLGKIECLAKGAKHIGAKLTPWVQPLHVIHLLLAPTRAGLPCIREVQAVKNYTPSSPLALRLSLRILSLLDKTMYPHIECREFMRKVYPLFTIISSSPPLFDLKKIWVEFELLLLEYLGAKPEYSVMPVFNINILARYLEKKIEEAAFIENNF